MNARAPSRALARVVTALPALLVVLLALPARADEPVHSQVTPAHADDRPGLLLLSFLVPLPLPLALLAPPSTSRRPVDVEASRQATAPRARVARGATD